MYLVCIIISAGFSVGGPVRAFRTCLNTALITVLHSSINSVIVDIPVPEVCGDCGALDYTHLAFLRSRSVVTACLIPGLVKCRAVPSTRRVQPSATRPPWTRLHWSLAIDVLLKVSFRNVYNIKRHDRHREGSSISGLPITSRLATACSLLSALLTENDYYIILVLDSSYPY